MGVCPGQLCSVVSHRVLRLMSGGLRRPVETPKQVAEWFVTRARYCLLRRVIGGNTGGNISPGSRATSTYSEEPSVLQGKDPALVNRFEVLWCLWTLSCVHLMLRRLATPGGGRSLVGR